MMKPIPCPCGSGKRSWLTYLHHTPLARVCAECRERVLTEHPRIKARKEKRHAQRSTIITNRVILEDKD